VIHDNPLLIGVGTGSFGEGMTGWYSEADA